MIDPLQAVLDMTAKASRFPVNSRYHGIDTATLETPDGRTVAYLRRRFIPQPDRFTTVHEHTVVQGDRLDNIAAKYIGDPEQFWRICDANGTMDPNDLTKVPGSKIRITLPEGIAGVNYG